MFHQGEAVRLPASPIRKVEGIQALRGLAMFLVFLFHFGGHWGRYSDVPAGPGWWREIGSLGTNTFLLISGLAVSWNLRARVTPWWEFVGRRLKRIYPPYLVVLSLYLAAGLMMPEYSKFSGDSARDVTYLVRSLVLLPGAFPQRPLITVTWTLALLVGFYLLAPCLASLGRRLESHLRGERLIWSISLAALAVLFAGTVPGDMNRASYLMLGFAASGFIRPGLRSDAFRCLLLLIVAAALIPVALTTTQGTVRMALESGAILALLGAMMAWPVWLDWACQPLTFLGDRSYSFYLLHSMVLKLFFEVALKGHHPTAGPWEVLGLVFLSALGAAAMLYRLVERPFWIPSEGLALPVVFLKLVQRRPARA